ncbi:unnamed protein product [Rotaria sp. Silwood1]|nr:unnamed protein product [Rotaria sp. Silwood1]CAF4834830.1 unnamed protein product [Rotaria sp. Silwood1]
MATPLPTVHVAHTARMRRRRSQSVTISNTGPQDNNIRVQSLGRKEFVAQLQKERLKQQMKHDEQDEGQDEQQHNEEDRHQPTVSRLAKSSRTMSMRKMATSAGVTVTTVKKELPSTASKTTHAQEDEQNHTHQVQVTHVPRLGSTRSIKRPNPITLESNGSYLESSQTLSNPMTASSIPLITSSSNYMTKSEIFDQEFSLNDGKDRTRRNDLKSQSSIRLDEQERNPNVSCTRPYASSSAHFLTSVVAIMIGCIAFAFSLTALVLVLLLRSTVDSKLGFFSIIATNSTTSSSSSGTLPSACSNYTTLDDPTRNVAAAGYALGCDTTSPFINRTMPVWIRFIGTGGSTLPLATPGMNLCGSEGTGWYDGTMPSSTGEIINGTACFTWYNSVCRFSSSISVANCGSFYIYNLPPPPACMLRYCTI